MRAAPCCGPWRFDTSMVAVRGVLSTCVRQHPSGCDLQASQEFFHPRPAGVSSCFRALCRAAKVHRESFVDPKFGLPRTETHQQMACILVLNILDPVRKAIRTKTGFDA